MRQTIALAILVIGATVGAVGIFVIVRDGDAAPVPITFENRSAVVVMVAYQPIKLEEEPQAFVSRRASHASLTQRASHFTTPRRDFVAPGQTLTIDYLSEGYDLYRVTIWSEDGASILLDEDYSNEELDQFNHRFIIQGDGTAGPEPSR